MKNEVVKPVVTFLYSCKAKMESFPLVNLDNRIATPEIHESCGQPEGLSAKPYAMTSQEGANDTHGKYLSMENWFSIVNRTCYPVSHKTQEDNATSVQSQHRVKSESGNEGSSVRTIEG